MLFIMSLNFTERGVREIKHGSNAHRRRRTSPKNVVARSSRSFSHPENTIWFR
jgi:hypothetical protein